jgi:hypothetical protein
MLGKILQAKFAAECAKALLTNVCDELARFDDESITLVRPVHPTAAAARRTAATLLNGAGRCVDDEAARLALELTLPTAITLRWTPAGIPSRSDVTKPRIRLGGCYAVC